MRVLTIIFFGSWKFAATFPLAIYAMNMSWIESIIYINIGGIIGSFGFAYLSDYIINLWKKLWLKHMKSSKKHKKIFTKRNRRIIKIKSKFGFVGIILLSPVLLSIPVGSFLIVKYYGARFKNILWLIAGQVGWSVIYTFFYTTIRTTLF